MDVGSQINQVVMIIRSQMNKKKQKLSVGNKCHDFGFVLGDPVRFRQILMNLFSNAVKYTPEGGSILLHMREINADETCYKYQFVVEDSGISMTEEFIAHIFDPFARAESDVREIQGTGLDMAITKRIIDAMDGSICVESTQGKGSRFSVELFFEKCPDEAVSDAVDRNRTNLKNADTSGENGICVNQNEAVSLLDMHFLCAEDNELNAEILTAMLEQEGAACTVYRNGRLLVDAFETVKPGEYDVILMDAHIAKPVDRAILKKTIAGLK